MGQRGGDFEYDSLMAEMVGKRSSGLVSLHIEGLLLGKSLGTGHPWEELSLQSQQDPKISKPPNTENKRPG